MAVKTGLRSGLLTTDCISVSMKFIERLMVRVFLIIYIICTSYVLCNELVDLNNPSFLRFYSNRIYVVDGTSINIYSLKDRALLKRFGKSGEGPGEFKRFAELNISGNKLIVTSQGRISQYSLEGGFINEKKMPDNISGLKIFGDKYAGYIFVPDRKKKVSWIVTAVFESDFNKVRELMRTSGTALGSKHLNPVTCLDQLGAECDVYKDTIVVNSYDSMNLFHGNREKVVVDLGIYRAVFTEKKKDKLLALWKRLLKSGESYNRYLKRFKYPSHYPAVRDYCIEEGKLYVFTLTKIKRERLWCRYLI